MNLKAQLIIIQILSNSIVSTIGTSTYFVKPKKNGTCSDNIISVTIAVEPLLTNNIISKPFSIICNNIAPSSFTESTPSGVIGTYNYILKSSQDGIKSSSVAGTKINKKYLSPALTDTTWFIRPISSGACRSIVSKIDFIGTSSYGYKWFSSTSAINQFNGIQFSINSVYNFIGTTNDSNWFY